MKKVHSLHDQIESTNIKKFIGIRNGRETILHLADFHLFLDEFSLPVSSGSKVSLFLLRVFHFHQ